MATVDEKREWITDGKGRAYSEREGAAYLKARRDEWREAISGLQVGTYVLAFLILGIVVPNDVDNRTAGGIIGAALLAFAVGLTLGSREREEPKHKTTFAGERPAGPLGEGVRWQDADD